MAFARRRVSVTLRSGLREMARVTLRLRAKGKGYLEAIGKDECIGKGGGDLKIKGDLDVEGRGRGTSQGQMMDERKGEGKGGG